MKFKQKKKEMESKSKMRKTKNVLRSWQGKQVGSIQFPRKAEEREIRENKFKDKFGVFDQNKHCQIIF